MLPESFQFLRGIFEMVIIIVVTPILFSSFKLELDFHFGVEQTTTMILYTIVLFIKAHLLIRVIYHFSSQSVSFLIISESFGGAIIEFIKEINNENKNAIDIILLFIKILGIVIILFTSLVYNEIIIINKRGLNKNVKSDIINRGQIEMQKIQNKFRFLSSMNNIELDENYIVDYNENINKENLDIENDDKKKDLIEKKDK